MFLLDFSPSGLTVTPLTIPLFQPMQVLKGSLAQITRQLSQFSAPDGTKPVWLDIEVTTQEYLSDLQRQVEALTASLPVDVLLLRRSREQRQHSLAQLDKETLSELNVEEVFARRLALDDALDADQIAQTTLRFKQTLADLEEQP